MQYHDHVRRSGSRRLAAQGRCVLRSAPQRLWGLPPARILLLRESNDQWHDCREIMKREEG